MSSITQVRGPYLQETFVELYMNGKPIFTPILMYYLTHTKDYTRVYFSSPSTRWVMFKRQLYRKNLGIFLALIAMYILATMHIICRWILMRNAFIDQGNTSLTTTVYLLQPPLWLTVLAAVVFTANTLVADCVLIWRCWTIWNRNWMIVGLPICCTLAGAGLGFKSIQEQAAYVINPNLDRNTYIDFATPYFALSLVNTCLATLLIIFRIITMTDRTLRTSRGYSRVIEIIVESALLYSIAMAVLLPLLVTESPNDVYAQAVVTQITGIAPTLIVARVTFGLARPDETWQAPPTLFNASSGTGSTLPAPSIALSRIHNIGLSTDTDGTKSDTFEK
ncbi:hypothetical protein DFH08DRAFT_978288 [Mycena albidolilacea]|uniref:Uncharacterized protein n=1 Tax=Mycena albidolilacea TaxID=1033008 RepID=A0AAD6YZ31_9AGAR|nr:hypothetical protein DFH08DRAFT_978288 [Mycena albidolilacea]